MAISWHLKRWIITIIGNNMLTHANPYPPRRSIGCEKRVVTQLHRPDRPEPPRPRHALRLVASRPPPSLRRPLQSPECESNGLNSAWNGGRVGPERSFVNCVDASDLRIVAPGRPGPPRLRNALAVQARKPKRPRRAPPPSLDETALGRPGRSGALYTACNGFNFALQTPIYTRCAPAASPRPSQATPAGPHALAV